jgi:hypothetical protein
MPYSDRSENLFTFEYTNSSNFSLSWLNLCILQIIHLGLLHFVLYFTPYYRVYDGRSNEHFTTAESAIYESYVCEVYTDA